MNHFLTLFLTFSYVSIFGQINFEFNHSESPIEVGVFVLENEQGNFIISATQQNELDGKSERVLFELNDQGDLLSQVVFPSAENSIITSLFEMDDHYLGIGFQNNEALDSAFLEIVEISSDLELLSDTLINIGFGSFFTLNSVLKNDTIYCVGVIDGILPYEPIIITISPPHEILQKNTDIDFSGLISSVIKNSNTNEHVVYGNGLLGVYDENWEFIQTIDFFDQFDIILNQQGQMRLHSDTTFLISGKVVSFPDPPTPMRRDIGIGMLDFNFELLRFESFGRQSDLQEDTIDFPALFNSIDFVTSDKIYVGGTSNRKVLPFMIIDEPSYFILSQFDELLNKNWERSYGGDAFYEMRSLHATQDGGCIMTGFRRDFINTPENIELYVLKVDCEGGIVSTTTIPLRKEIATAYPNPFQDYFQMDISEKLLNVDDLKLELVDLNGRVVIQQDIDDLLSNINTANLSVGNYIVIIKDKNDNVIWQDKLVKGL